CAKDDSRIVQVGGGYPQADRRHPEDNRGSVKENRSQVEQAIPGAAITTVNFSEVGRQAGRAASGDVISELRRPRPHGDWPKDHCACCVIATLDSGKAPK